MGGSLGVPMYCPEEVQTMPNFDLNKFMGRWYGIVKTYNEKLKYEVERLKCVTITYLPRQPDNNKDDEDNQLQIDVLFEAITNDRAKRKIQKKAIGFFPEEGNPAKMAIRMVEDDNQIGNNWILDTDYTTFALVYSRKFENDKLEHYAWILGRTPHFMPDVVDRLIPVMMSYGIEPRHLIKENHNYD